MWLIAKGVAMAVRPSWEGHLRLSLVTRPVALYSATSGADTVRFNLINPETNNRIMMVTVDAGTGEEVSRSDLVKGFEVTKGEYVLRTAGEVRDVGEVPHPELPKADARMLYIAEKIVEQQSGDFEPSEFTDRYEDALRALIEEKRKGRPVRPMKPANDDTKVVDLMEALRNSPKGGGTATNRPRTERLALPKAKTAKKKPTRRRAA
jgi:non-homologous end joining protein Ku